MSEPPEAPLQTQDPSAILDLLRCPLSGSELVRAGERLVAAEGGHAYPVTASGIPLFGEQVRSPAAAQQQAHYDQVAEAYLANLEYPHTQEYERAMEGILLDHIQPPLGTTVELCCGRGEALRMGSLRYQRGLGIDISVSMLEAGLARRPRSSAFFAQGDATRLPLADRCCDSVFMLGGIHHVNDRSGLFSEVSRILRPGGRLYWREPVDDFLPWRLARKLIYRLAPALDEQTEQPLRYEDTVPVLEQAGLEVEVWRTAGFASWALLMNSDVLVVNRLFRHVPGIRRLTRIGVRLDEQILGLPGMERRGIQVVGVARKAE